MNKDGEIVEIYRDNKKDWSILINGIITIVKKYPQSFTYCETNGIGDVVFDLLRKALPTIRPFVTSNESKNEIIEELIHAFMTGAIKIPTEKLFGALHKELLTYTFKYSPATRKLTYNSMEGYHDDTVMSLALSLKARQKKNLSYSFI
jgi:hypothetical protein